ncbi:hypothetical protein P170DRAFT_454210 [Aspergillus steynii IBT 23096]|uniref:Peroxisome membrane anchor protein Pex14p N-terminal domain-containing protein n=1 Tax=Aspergillus steynii IBT 23096 TaxID=1392250 RepID=A0A2I2GJF6_9EURO|nr:uncharacterized protein P170DRAFT_454210 [Aspergillus steynii IBT 23096]PLB53006.1 hypothetical protein P170DRAFT_454210 [Aspergillus steynii IBT 23096]
MAREELISSADPAVASSPVEKKVAFLQSKNLTKEEVDIALSRAGEDPSAAAAVTASSSSTGYQSPPPQSVYRPPPPPSQGYGYPPYGQWQPPPEPPKRDWRDWFIMATVMGGVGYGMYFVAKRYITPLIAPPTPPQLEQDKENIDEQFSRAFTLIEQLSTDTAALKSAEEARTERLDTALREVENLVADLKTSSRRRDDETRRISDEVKSLKDAIPKALEGAREGNENRLKELGTELKSLKVLLGNRIGGAGSNSPAVGKSVGTSLPTASRPSEESTPTTTPAAATTNGASATPAAQESQPSTGAAPTASTPTTPSAGGNPLSQFSRSASIPAWQMAAANRSKTASPATPATPTANAGDSSSNTTDKHHRSDRHRRHHHHHHRDSHGHSHRDRDHKSHRHSRHHGHDHGHRSRRSERPSSSSQQQHAPVPPPAPVILPMQARELSKRDLPTYEPMFAMYLDIQKGIILEDLSEEEVKGRWKSFVGKWNRGLLAEGWYDPSTLEKARREAESHPPVPSSRGQFRGSPDYEDPRDETAGASSNANLRDPEVQGDAAEDDDNDDDDDYGPGLPTRYGLSLTGHQNSGPSIPTMQDLDLRNESAVEDAIAARQDAQKYRRAELQSHKSEMRQMEDEVAPRAEPGTHERRMEKRMETAAANRAFAQNRRGGSPTDAAPEEELMGSGADDLEAMKKAQEKDQRKKNEREIRREEILRARAAEREERLQQYRRKEDETIGWLKTLAKQRFG